MYSVSSNHLTSYKVFFSEMVLDGLDLHVQIFFSYIFRSMSCLVHSMYCCLVTKMCLFFVTPWTRACQAPLSMEFSRQECCRGLPFPSPGDLPNSGLEPLSPALAGGFFITESLGRPPQYEIHTPALPY